MRRLASFSLLSAAEDVCARTATDAAARHALPRNRMRHASFQAQDATTRADLHNAKLVKADLRAADLSGANLRGADLREANLHGAKLAATQFIGAKMLGMIDVHGNRVTTTPEPTARRTRRPMRRQKTTQPWWKFWARA